MHVSFASQNVPRAPKNVTFSHKNIPEKVTHVPFSQKNLPETPAIIPGSIQITNYQLILRSAARSAGSQACFACRTPPGVRFFSNRARLRLVSRLGSLRYVWARITRRPFRPWERGHLCPRNAVRPHIAFRKRIAGKDARAPRIGPPRNISYLITNQ
jgi:hypothetical protein